VIGPSPSLSSQAEEARRGDLIENLGRFCRILRERGIPVSLDKELDAASALLHIDLLDPLDFYLSIKATLLSRKQDERVFDEAFRLFWTDRTRSGLPRQMKRRERKVTGLFRQIRKDLVAAGSEEETGNRDETGSGTEDQPIPGYSPVELLRRKSFEAFTESDLEEMERALAEMVVKLVTRRSRRLRPSDRGYRIDLRRSFRHTLRYGGELVELAYLERRVEHPRIVLLCDTSGSMDPYSRFLIRFLFSLKRTADQVEVFVFSTSLTRLTSLFSRGEIAEVLDRVSDVARDWSGGTAIGESLDEFLSDYGGQMLGPHSVVVILSDGLDRGDTDSLEHAMRGIRKQAERIIWLNPLAGTQGYEPTCRGMAVAMPFVDHFASAHNLESLEKVIEHLSI
jgi:uncharacterized protein with von Willebrand factor type A (vWA) domain